MLPCGNQNCCPRAALVLGGGKKREGGQFLTLLGLLRLFGPFGHFEFVLVEGVSRRDGWGVVCWFYPIIEVIHVPELIGLFDLLCTSLEGGVHGLELILSVRLREGEGVGTDLSVWHWGSQSAVDDQGGHEGSDVFELHCGYWSVVEESGFWCCELRS